MAERKVLVYRQKPTMTASGSKTTSIHQRILAAPKRLIPCIATTNEVKGVGIKQWKSKLACSGLLPMRLPRIPLNLDKSRRDSRSIERPISSLLDFERYLCCVQAQCQVSDLSTVTPSTTNAISNQLTRVALGLDKTRHLFSQYAPSVALVAQGYRFESGLIRRVSIEQGVPLLAVENTAFHDRFLWDSLSGITTNFNLSKNYYWRLREHTDPVVVSNYIDQLIANTRNLKRQEHKSPVNSCKEVGRPYLLFLGQVYTDSAVLFGLGDWPSPEKFIASVIEVGRKHEMDVVIKLHPKESNGSDPVCNQPYNELTFKKLHEHPTTRELINSPGIVIDHDNRFDTYDLIDNAAVAITLTSQAGLEASFRGVPTIVGGPAFYSGLGFTFDVSNELALDSAIRQAISAGSDSSRTENARNFTYIHFEKYCQPKTFRSLRHIIRFAKAEPI